MRGKENSSQAKVFSTLVPFPRDILLILSFLLLPAPPPFSLRLQSFQVQPLTLQLPIYQESGKPEEGFDHRRALITVNEYANETATQTPPSCPQDHLRGEKLPGTGSRTSWRERGPEGGGLVEPSQNPLLFLLSSRPGKARESFQTAGSEDTEGEKVLREEGGY